MIVFDHVSKVYSNGTVGLDDVNLTIQDGEFVAIIGRSGAGKSTLLRAVNRMHRITAGTLTVNGTDVSTLSGKALRQFRRGIGMVFQSFNLVTRTSVIKNVLSACVPDMPFWRVLLGAFRKEDKLKALESLDKVGILDKAYMRADQLSGGQQQRVALARAFVIEPSVLLMDEPLSNLDAKLRVQMRSVIKKLQRRLGITTIYVTHDQEEALAISDRIAVMKDGHIMQIGTPNEIYAKPQNPFVAGFIGVSNFLDCEVSAPGGGVADVSIKGELNIQVPVRREYSGNGKISARPEQLFFSADGMPGTILFSTFLGDFIEYEVQLDDGQNLIVNEYTKDTAEVHTDGEKVHLSFDPLRISLYDVNEEVLSL